VAVGTVRFTEAGGGGRRTSRRLAWTGVFAVAISGFAYLAGFAKAVDADLFFGRRARALEEMARTIQDRVPPDQPVSVLEIGIIGYRCRNPIVDRAGIVTPGLAYHNTSLLASMREAWRLHPTDYLVVNPSEFPLVAGSVDVIRVVDGFGYSPLALVRRSRQPAARTASP
jgi:hypothetical protein